MRVIPSNCRIFDDIVQIQEIVNVVQTCKYDNCLRMAGLSDQLNQCNLSIAFVRRPTTLFGCSRMGIEPDP